MLTTIICKHVLLKNLSVKKGGVVVKVIKSNVYSRKASLIEGQQQVSLFHQNGISCLGIYLNSQQQYSFAVEPNVVAVLSIFAGSAEIQCVKTTEQLEVSVVTGDVIQTPSSSTLKIFNISANGLIASLLMVHTK